MSNFQTFLTFKVALELRKFHLRHTKRRIRVSVGASAEVLHNNSCSRRRGTCHTRQWM